MRTDAMAATYLEQAKARLETAKRAHGEGEHAYCVRQAQECVELSLKGALRLYAIEYPREHDVKPLLLKVSDRFPTWFSNQAGELGRISEQLAKDRGPSMYGDEERGIPPSELFDEAYASGVLRDAGLVHKQCMRLFREFKSSPRRKSSD